jgi:hypothetical protein
VIIMTIDLKGKEYLEKRGLYTLTDNTRMYSGR